jgi:lysophospholipase L1-like esterase
LTIAAATAATEDGQAAVTFDGAEMLTIPPGEEAAGDPMDLPVAPGADLFLSLYLPEETGLATYSHKPMETAHIVGGNHVTSPAVPEAEQVEARFYVSGVDVLTPDDTAIAVAFGDSWFEGVGSTTGANNRSVDFLNRDVLSIPALTHVLVQFGMNDLGLPGMMSGEPPATSEALIEGFKALAHRAHQADLKILAATIGPFAGAVYPGVSTPEGLAARREVNDWIRTTDSFDAVFDVARAVENPEAPDYIHPALDSGDGMHLNHRGAQAMANAVDPETLAR